MAPVHRKLIHMSAIDFLEHVGVRQRPSTSKRMDTGFFDIRDTYVGSETNGNGIF